MWHHVDRIAIRYDSGYLTCSKKLTGSQPSLPHGINRKLKCETKNKMMSVISPVRFRCYKRRRSRSWSTVSNAAVRSSRHKAETSPVSAAMKRSLYTLRTAISVLWCWRYADCWLIGINSLLSRKACSRLMCTTLSNSFERNDKFDTGLQVCNS